MVAGLAEPLTGRELEVLGLLAAGMANQQIAKELVVALETANKHVSYVLGKLGAANRTQAVARARELASSGSKTPRPTNSLEVANLGWTGGPPWPGFPCTDPFERCPGRPATPTVQIKQHHQAGWSWSHHEERGGMTTSQLR
jgi:DNA-binding CsgD family transcriptional regulator